VRQRGYVPSAALDLVKQLKTVVLVIGNLSRNAVSFVKSWQFFFVTTTHGQAFKNLLLLAGKGPESTNELTSPFHTKIEPSWPM
jgi:hypothetical protein